MIVYWLVPYLVATAPAVIVLLAILVGGCAMTRTADDPLDRANYYSEPNGRTGEELTRELDRRAAREQLRRIVEEGAR